MDAMDTDWRDYLRRNGFPDAEELGRGMEAAAFALGGGRVAKVWFGRSEADLRPLVAFYEERGRLSLPFATPEIYDVRAVDGWVLTLERELPGSPLSTALETGAVGLADAYECALRVLEALATTKAGPAAEALPLFNEDAPLWHGNDARWGDALAALVRLRLARFGPQLRPAVTRFDAKMDRVLDLLGGLPPDPRQVVHGDLCLPNILVDTAGRVRAVLDWGFLSTRGDHAFDASTFAGFFDMYGPAARQHDDELTDLICVHFGYSRELLLLYRACYALIGSNAYDPTGRDGHFAWCVATLNRADISELLLA